MGTRIQKTYPQKSYKLAVGTQSYTVKYTAANMQFDWLEMSLIYEKRNLHKAVYGNYKVNLESTAIYKMS